MGMGLRSKNGGRLACLASGRLWTGWIVWLQAQAKSVSSCFLQCTPATWSQAKKKNYEHGPAIPGTSESVGPLLGCRSARLAPDWHQA